MTTDEAPLWKGLLVWFISIVLFVLIAMPAFAEPPNVEPPSGWFGDGLSGAKPKPRLKKNECYYLAQDSNPLPAEMFPQRKNVVQEMRIRLCYYEWAYTISVMRRLVSDEGPMTPWDYKVNENVWLYVGAGAQPPEAEHAFPADSPEVDE
jgi:hypothetical protein